MKVKKKNWVIIIFVISSVFIVTFFTLWGVENIPSQEELCKAGVDFYKQEAYTGIVIDKFIDKEQHNYKKVIIEEDFNDKVVYLDADVGGVYNYIMIGDSLMKNKGELFLLVNRKGKDTLIDFKFRCY